VAAGTGAAVFAPALIIVGTAVAYQAHSRRADEGAAVDYELGRIGWRLSRRGTPAEALPWTMHPWVVANDRLRAVGWEPTHTNEEAFVAAARPNPFSRLFARRRQEMTLGAAGLLAAGLAAGIIAIIRSRRRRQRSGGAFARLDAQIHRQNGSD